MIMMQPILRITDGKSPETTHSISAEVVSIGRESGNQIQILDTEASRRHAEIRQTETGHFEIFDLNSSNGTLVNGQKANRCRLRSGDQITIGTTSLIFLLTQTSTTYTAEQINVVLKQGDADGSRIIADYSQHYPNTGRKNTHSKYEAINADSNTAPTNRDQSLDVIYQTAVAIGRTEDLGEVLDRILQLVFDWVEADRGCIMLRDTQDQTLYPAARRDRVHPIEENRRDPISISKSIADHVLEQQIGVRTSNAKEDSRFESSPSIVTRGIREALCVPLQGRYSIVGLLYVDTYTPPGRHSSDELKSRFTNEHLKIITAIGYQAAVAIEDTHYYSSLLKSERLTAMGQALTSLSHDIKNILQGIKGGSYLIDAGLNQKNAQAVRRGWTMVERNQERISNLVLDMLTFSKDREPNLKHQDINELVKEVFEDFENRSRELSIEFSLQLESQPVYCSFDYDSLYRAILNLLINAVDAVTESHNNDHNQNTAAPLNSHSAEGSHKTEQGPHTHDDDAQEDDTQVPKGKVTVHTSVLSDGNCKIEIGDNGAGIPDEIRGKIFTLFESTKGARGTGIGLPVSAKIIEEHHGTIAIVEPQDGKGTIFQITLPRSTQNAASNDLGTVFSDNETLS